MTYFDPSYFDPAYFDVGEVTASTELRRPTRKRHRPDYGDTQYFPARPGGKNPTR